MGNETENETQVPVFGQSDTIARLGGQEFKQKLEQARLAREQATGQKSAGMTEETHTEESAKKENVFSIFTGGPVAQSRPVPSKIQQPTNSVSLDSRAEIQGQQPESAPKIQEGMQEGEKRPPQMSEDVPDEIGSKLARFKEYVSGIENRVREKLGDNLLRLAETEEYKLFGIDYLKARAIADGLDETATTEEIHVAATNLEQTFDKLVAYIDDRESNKDTQGSVQKEPIEEPIENTTVPDEMPQPQVAYDPISEEVSDVATDTPPDSPVNDDVEVADVKPTAQRIKELEEKTIGLMKKRGVETDTPNQESLEQVIINTINEVASKNPDVFAGTDIPKEEIMQRATANLVVEFSESPNIAQGVQMDATYQKAA